MEAGFNLRSINILVNSIDKNRSCLIRPKRVTFAYMAICPPFAVKFQIHSGLNIKKGNEVPKIHKLPRCSNKHAIQYWLFSNPTIHMTTQGPLIYYRRGGWVENGGGGSTKYFTMHGEGVSKKKGYINIGEGVYEFFLTV